MSDIHEGASPYDALNFFYRLSNAKEVFYEQNFVIFFIFFFFNSSSSTTIQFANDKFFTKLRINKSESYIKIKSNNIKSCRFSNLREKFPFRIPLIPIISKLYNRLKHNNCAQIQGSQTFNILVALKRNR